MAELAEWIAFHKRHRDLLFGGDVVRLDLADDTLVGHGVVAPDRGRAATLRAEYPDVTAIFVAADQQAVGLLAGLHRAGVGVPGEVAVASFDGSPEGEFTIPALTSARVPVPDLAADAVAAVLDAHAEPRTVGHPCELVVRRSCGC